MPLAQHEGLTTRCRGWDAHPGIEFHDEGLAGRDLAAETFSQGPRRRGAG